MTLLGIFSLFQLVQPSQSSNRPCSAGLNRLGEICSPVSAVPIGLVLADGAKTASVWMFVSFHFTSSGSRLAAWPEPGTNPYGVGANRKGAVVRWVEGIESGSTEHPPRFVSVPGETTRWVLRPTSVTAAPVRQ